MIVILKEGTTVQQRESLCDWFRSMELEVHISQGQYKTIIGLIGDTTKVDINLVESLNMIESVKRITEPFKNANRKFHTDDSVVDINGFKIGGGSFQVIAGPCSVESRDQIIAVAESVKASGANLLRGGAFKPRTSPYAVQGLHADGIELLLKAKKATANTQRAIEFDRERLEVVKRVLGDIKLSAITARTIEGFQAKRRVEGASNRTVNMDIGALRQRRCFLRRSGWHFLPEGPFCHHRRLSGQ